MSCFVRFCREVCWTRTTPDIFFKEMYGYGATLSVRTEVRVLSYRTTHTHGSHLPTRPSATSTSALRVKAFSLASWLPVEIPP